MEWFFLTLRYVFTAVPFVFAVVFALAGFWVLVATASRVSTGAMVIGGAFLIQTAFVMAPYLPLGLRVSTDDLAFLLLAAALVVRWLFFGQPRIVNSYGVWLLIGAALFVSLGIGLLQFGTPAGVEARPNFYFWMAGLYFASFTYTPDVMKKLWRVVQWCAWLVAVVVIYRWVGLKYGFVSERLVEFAGASSEFRVVGSHPTFFLAMVGTAYFALWLRHSRATALWAAMFMLGLVLVLQHRSVWVAAVGALAVLAWHQRALVSKKAFQVVGLGIVAVGLMGALVALNPSSRLTETITRSAVSVTESHGTHVDRVEGWRVLLRDYTRYAPQEWLLGKPYGSGYERYVEGRLKEYSPHNFYIQLLLRVGAVGLLLFLWVHFALHRQVRAGMPTEPSDATLHAVLLAALAASLLYYIPYQGFFLQGALYGVLIGWLATRPQPVQAPELNVPLAAIAQAK